MSEMVFEQATRAHSPEIAKFLELDPDFFVHEYDEYDPTNSVFSMLKKGDQILGTQAFMPYRLNWSGKVLLTGRSERTRLDSSLRGQGMFGGLMSDCEDHGKQQGMQFAWGFTTAKRPFRKVGYQTLDGFLEHAIAVLKPAGALQEAFQTSNKKMKKALLATSALSPLLSNFGRLTRGFGSKPYRVETEVEQALDIADLYQRLRGDDRLLTIEQDDAFLKWMYSKTSDYKKLYVYRNSELVAYVVVYVGDGAVAKLIDFGFEEPRAFFVAWARMVRELKDTECAAVRTAYNVTNPILRGARHSLFQLGFVPLHRGATMVVKPLLFQDQNLLSESSAWHITPLWSHL